IQTVCMHVVDPTGGERKGRIKQQRYADRAGFLKYPKIHSNSTSNSSSISVCGHYSAGGRWSAWVMRSGVCCVCVGGWWCVCWVCVVGGWGVGVDTSRDF